MDDRLASVERRLDAVTRELADVRARLQALEGEKATVDPLDPSIESVAPAVIELSDGTEEVPVAETPEPSARSSGAVAHLGRSLMVLGGAYLLRAITESQVVPPIAGAAVGLIYAAAWLYFCERAAAAGERVSAGFHGVVSLFIAYPLIWEASTRLSLFSAAPAAGVLVSFFVLASAPGWHRQLKEVVWANTGLAVLSALALGVATRSPVAFTAALLVIAGFTEWSARLPDFANIRAVAALGLDAALGLLVAVRFMAAAVPEGFGDVPALHTILLVAALAGVYLSSFALRTLRARHPVTVFDVLQTAFTIALGVTVLAGMGAGGPVRAVIAGVVLLACGALTYATAFGVIDRISGRTLNFYVYMGFAVLLVLAGTLLAVGATASAVAWCGMGGVALWLGGNFDRITLRFHGAAYLAGAVIASGLFTYGADALFARAAGPWAGLDPLDAVVSVVASSGYVILARTRRSGFSWLELVPQATIACVLVWVCAGFGARALGLVFAHAPGPRADAGMLAASRTVVLSVVSVALAGAARRFSLRDLGWFVYPVLVIEAGRLALEDVRQGRPGTLFVTFAAYGAALIVVSRLARKRET